MNYDHAGTLASGQAAAPMRFERFLHTQSFDLATATALQAALEAEIATLDQTNAKIRPYKRLQVDRIEDVLEAQIDSFISPGPEEAALVRRLKRCLQLCGELLLEERMELM